MSTAFIHERCRRLARSAVLAALIVALVCTSIAPAFAAGGQFGNLSGTVYDQSTKTAVAGATVTVVSPSGTYHAKSDSKGSFTILGIPVDTYLVTVESPGYLAQTYPGVTILGDQTQGLGTIYMSKEKEIARVTSRSFAGKIPELKPWK